MNYPAFAHDAFANSSDRDLYQVLLISYDSHVNCTPPLYPLPLRVRQLPTEGFPPAALVSPQAGRGREA